MERSINPKLKGYRKMPLVLLPRNIIIETMCNFVIHTPKVIRNSRLLCVVFLAIVFLFLLSISCGVKSPPLPPPQNEIPQQNVTKGKTTDSKKEIKKKSPKKVNPDTNLLNKEAI